MEIDEYSEQYGQNDNSALVELKIVLPEDLYRAWQRCSWILVSETGRTRPEIMREMVVDFLKKYSC